MKYSVISGLNLYELGQLVPYIIVINQLTYITSQDSKD